ncbi:hypothetical protein BDU57DRAFT_217076 [Ampelomyces quisqualis]|uniref:Uncharacterized protein n=1 Tax=Ampelomyces quisqualis TaxID=50730 RepID=A0A6A5QN32_AMPQU|nr:hypothetical protein BDU57DRAFT_217076 [Ampelomyces quisqualis]
MHTSAYMLATPNRKQPPFVHLPSEYSVFISSIVFGTSSGMEFNASSAPQVLASLIAASVILMAITAMVCRDICTTQGRGNFGIRCRAASFARTNAGNPEFDDNTIAFRASTVAYSAKSPCSLKPCIFVFPLSHQALCTLVVRLHDVGVPEGHLKRYW